MNLDDLRVLAVHETTVDEELVANHCSKDDKVPEQHVPRIKSEHGTVNQGHPHQT